MLFELGQYISRKVNLYLNVSSELEYASSIIGKQHYLTLASHVKPTLLSDKYGITPNDNIRCVVLTALANYALDLVDSGQFHLHLGFMMQEGNDLQDIHSKLLLHLVSIDLVKEEDAQRAIDSLKWSVECTG